MAAVNGIHEADIVATKLTMTRVRETGRAKLTTLFRQYYPKRRYATPISQLVGSLALHDY
jgi:hypothetical protein